MAVKLGNKNIRSKFFVTFYNNSYIKKHGKIIQALYIIIHSTNYINMKLIIKNITNN